MATPVELHVDQFLQPVDPDGAIIHFTEMLATGSSLAAENTFLTSFGQLWTLVKEWRALAPADQERLVGVCYLRATRQIPAAAPKTLTTLDGALTALDTNLNVAGDLEDGFLAALAGTVEARAGAGSALHQQLDNAAAPIALLQQQLGAIGANLLAALEALGAAEDLLTAPPPAPANPPAQGDIGRQLYAWIVLMILIITFPIESGSKR